MGDSTNSPDLSSIRDGLLVTLYRGYGEGPIEAPLELGSKPVSDLYISEMKVDGEGIHERRMNGG